MRNSHKFSEYKKEMSRNKETGPMGRPPRAAALLGAPPKAAPLCSLLLLIYLFILWILMVIPCMFLVYFTYIYIYMS